MPNGKRILVVDDEADVLAAVSKSLALAGFVVESAANEAEALAVCQQQSFDAVVLDFLIPPTDGLRLLAKIRNVRPLVRSIIMSGKLPTDVEKSRIERLLKETVDADAYIPKPPDPDDLERTLHQLLAEPLDEWQRIADQTLKGQKTTQRVASEAAKALKRLKHD